MFAIESLGEDQRRLTKLAGVRLPGVKISADLHLAVRGFRVHTKYSRHSRNAVVDNADDQLHCVVTLSLPDQGRTHPVPEPAFHCMQRVRIFFVIASDVVCLSPKAKVVGSDVERMISRALAIGYNHRSARLV